MSSEKKNHSRILADYVSAMKYDDFSKETVDNAKSRIIDFFASAMAGKKTNEPMNKAAMSVMKQMGGVPESTVMFNDCKIPASNAAFMNGFYGHGADLDDGNIIAMGHPGVHVVPAVFSAAEVTKSSVKDILTAIIAGYDVFVRVSAVVMPSLLTRGFHSTGVIGSIASAAAVAKLLGLDADGIHRAMGLGAIATSGLFETSQTAQSMKPLNSANAARTGVFSAQFASAGAESPEEPFDGVKGFFRAFADETKPDEIEKDLGKVFHVDTSYTKLYPACRHIHGILDCVIEFYREGVKPENIDKIILYLYPNGIPIVGGIREPKDEGGAKFSVFYCAAIGLTKGSFGLKDLENPQQISKTALDLIGKMELVSAPELEIREKRIRGARIEIVHKDGTISKKEVAVPKGEPQSPVTWKDMKAKLEGCAEGVLSKEKQQKFYDLIYSFETLSGIDEIMDILK